MTERERMDIKELQGLSRFLVDGGHHHAKWLHDHGVPKNTKHANKFLFNRAKSLKKFVDIERRAGKYIFPANLPLKILIVENNIKEFPEYDILCASSLWDSGNQEIKWYIKYIKEENLPEWERELRSLKQKKSKEKKLTVKVNCLSWDTGKPETGTEVELKCDSIDLVLQDIYLSNSPDSHLGYHLTEHYFDLMPQAIVFLLTSMDVEHLAATGISHRADAVISKTRMGAIWWYYYQAFHELFGAMFWEPWCKKETDKEKDKDKRRKLRGLFGCLRRWLKEPEILWHGQNLPEMIDHGHQHITELWQVSRDILGTAIELSPKFARKFDTEMRILITLGIWLHDVGHRGDALNTDPISIRDSHGAISERLLLEDPQAFGLDWLLKLCENQEKTCNCGCNPEGRKKIRNTVDTKKPLCLLRKLGLVCRSHQSSAPLWPEKVAAGFHGLKFPGVYTRMGFEDNIQIQEKASNDSVKEWLDSNLDLDWSGSDIRCLKDYDGDDSLINLTCLLRWLDALHISRRRTGSQVRQSTHRLFLKEREKWCLRRLKELARILETSSPGSSSYIKALSEQGGLLGYYHLLGVQDIHLWRHDAVDRIRIGSEKKGRSRAAITITYDVYPQEIEGEVKKQLETQCECTHEDLLKVWQGADEKIILWAAHMRDNVIDSEMKSQKDESKSKDDSKSIVEKFFGSSLDIKIYFAPEGKDQDKKLLWP